MLSWGCRTAPWIKGANILASFVRLEIQLSCRICPQTLCSGMSWPRIIHLSPRWEHAKVSVGLRFKSCFMQASSSLRDITAKVIVNKSVWSKQLVSWLNASAWNDKGSTNGYFYPRSSTSALWPCLGNVRRPTILDLNWFSWPGYRSMYLGDSNVINGSFSRWCVFLR